MYFRLIRGWNGWRTDKIFPQMSAGQGRLLVKRGFAEEITPPRQPVQAVQRKRKAASKAS